MKAVLAVFALGALGILTVAALVQALRGVWAAGHGAQGDRAYDAEYTRLCDERDRLLNHLREIRFDYATGKLDERDFTRLAQRYEAEAAACLDALAAWDKKR